MEVLQLLFPGLCRLVPQTGRRRLLAAGVTVFHICGPERSADGVREREENASDGHHFEEDGGDTKAVDVSPGIVGENL